MLFSLVAAARATEGVFPHRCQKEVLPNGLTVRMPSLMAYTAPKPESVLAEDREISVFPLHIKAENIQIVPVTALFEK